MFWVPVTNFVLMLRWRQRYPLQAGSQVSEEETWHVSNRQKARVQLHYLNGSETHIHLETYHVW